ncbi:PAS domain S-box protein [Fluviicola taffensis]|uniref:Putative PAS/PAC sensor protein n=1 Tax=Fluviicola taffensis (strain DSM 16823 / NCIMB 13979 / RW262) TaxID=755732 RepID=F2IKA8_FLUTR|nr:PAS domain S-box protein [Fluviicola taffensis]AEA44011.1 putative PAS/PAC sensor protein [Fluviicola taffensis DSM 16823]
MKLRIFLSLISLLVVSLKLHAQLHTFREYNHRDGLKITSTLSTTQDELGYLLIGTDGDGIVRFNGTSFESIHPPKGLDRPYHVTGILQINNEVYFSTLYQGVLRYYNNEIHSIYKQNLDVNGEVLRISRCQKNISVICKNSIIIIDLKGKVLLKKSYPSGSITRCIELLEVPNGSVLFTDKESYFINSHEVVKLSKWVNSGNTTFKMASYQDKKLNLYNQEGTFKYSYFFGENGTIIRQTKEATNFKFAEQAIENITSKNELILFNTTENDLFEIKGNKLTKIERNYDQNLAEISQLFIDASGDYWLNTSQGITKVSVEPFTKLKLNPIFENKLITHVFKTKKNELLISSGNQGIHFGNLTANNYQLKTKLTANHILECPLGTLICTNDGIYEFKNHEIIPSSIPNQKGENIRFAIWDGKKLWFAPVGKGLFKYDPQSKISTKITIKKSADCYYCGQVSADGKFIYFGTNEGVKKLNLQSNKLIHLKAFNEIGSYTGNSTKDIYGNLWFTLDRGIAGIDRNHNLTKITDRKLLPSFLFYTLSSDKSGHLILGTNLGIHILKVNNKAKVIYNKDYNETNGFLGYETNMRATFQDNNICYVGTSEGLFLINTEILQNYPVPPKPIILKGRLFQNGVIRDVDNGKYLTFKTILAKNKGLEYHYRIDKFHKSWQKLTSTSEMKMPELENGTYNLEVKSTFDGINFSETTLYPITAHTPAWQSKWFILIIILILGILNIAYLEWTRTGMRVNLYEISYNSLDPRFIPKLLLFASITNVLVGIIIYYFVDEALAHVTVNIVASSILMLGYFIHRITARRNRLDYINNLSLYLSLMVLFVQFFYILFITNIHSYPIVAIILVSSALPYLLNNIRSIIIICLLEIFISVLMLLWIEKPIYNGVLFVLTIGVSSALTVMVTYLRNDSLEKLFFVSNILNKGNMMAISFDQKGIITYCSKNLSSLLHIDSNMIVGKSLSTLNPIVVSAEMREFSLGDEFSDGKIFLVPMYNKKGEVIWIEWSCKYFSDSVRVIMGQDVTEKLTLTTNYQSLVENANDMIFNTDIDGNFTYVNEMSSRVFGYRNENLIGKNSMSVVLPDYREIVKEFFSNQFLNRIQNTYLEFPIRTKEGRIVWLGQNASIVFEPGSRKRIIGFTALARDITEKRANELLIEQQNKDITSSINSAKRIQYSLLPKATEIGSYFQDYFIVFKPKDIVSGDFYWSYQIEDKLILVLADCTGHGVPGAFMTILGINLLNQFVIERNIHDPAKILNDLNNELHKLLQHEGNPLTNEGLDALVTIFENDTIQFATSGVALIHTTPTDFILYRSTKKEVEAEVVIYENNSITLADDDQIYLITDGFQKQFGSIRNKKFSFKRVKELLEQVKIESMPLQKKYFENAWSNWSEGHEQTDDITVIGLKKYIPKKKS